MKSPITIVAAISAMAIGGYVATPTEQVVHPTVRRSALDADENNASISLVGQMRTSLSSWLYLRADMYLHNGVELRQLTDTEKHRGQQGVGSSDNLIASDAQAVTVVPSEQRDFRGFLGAIERETSTYKAMEHHGHQGPEQSLPLFRLMVLADPQFITGWTMAGSILASDHSDKSIDKALQFLLSGLEQNKDSIELWDAVGVLYAAYKRDFKRAQLYLNEGKKLAALDKHRSESEAEALLETFRWLTLIAKETGTDFDRIRVAREGLQYFPDDELLKRLG